MYSECSVQLHCSILPRIKGFDQHIESTSTDYEGRSTNILWLVLVQRVQCRVLPMWVDTYAQYMLVQCTCTGVLLLLLGIPGTVVQLYVKHRMHTRRRSMVVDDKQGVGRATQNHYLTDTICLLELAYRFLFEV
jgi:hypothetical protein